MLEYFYIFKGVLICLLVKSDQIQSAYPFPKSHAEMFKIDVHALLNERMDRQYLLYSLREILTVSDQWKFCKLHKA